MLDEQNDLNKPQDELSEDELEQVSGGHGPIGQPIGSKSADDNEERSVKYQGFAGGVTVASGDVND